MIGKANSLSAVKNESRLSPHRSFEYIYPIDEISSPIAPQQLGYGDNDRTKTMTKTIIQQRSSPRRKFENRRTSSSAFMPLNIEDINSSKKRSGMTVFPRTSLSLHLRRSIDPSHQNQIERVLNQDDLFGRDNDDSEEFFLTLPTAAREHYIYDPSSEAPFEAPYCYARKIEYLRNDE